MPCKRSPTRAAASTRTDSAQRRGRLLAGRHECAVVLLSRGDPEPEVVVIGILILLAVEHGLLSENVERRRRKLGARGSSLAMTHSPTPPGSEIHTDS